jgi:hypothetical protein
LISAEESLSCPYRIKLEHLAAPYKRKREDLLGGNPTVGFFIELSLTGALPIAIRSQTWTISWMIAKIKWCSGVRFGAGVSYQGRMVNGANMAFSERL